MHPSQHTSDAPQLPGRADDVLPAEGVGELRQREQSHVCVHGHLAPAPTGRRLGHAAKRTQCAPTPTGTLDSGATALTALPRLAHGRQREPPRRRRAEGERSDGGRKMKGGAGLNVPLSPPGTEGKQRGGQEGGVDGLSSFFPESEEGDAERERDGNYANQEKLNVDD